MQLYYLKDSPEVKELQNVFDLVKKQYLKDKRNGVKEALPFTVSYGMKDIHEFVSEGLSSKRFQEYMSTIKVGDQTAI